MERITRKKDQYECRFKGGCPAEDWIEDLTGIYSSDWNNKVCTFCPFMVYINHLAEIEDVLEDIEDDGR